MNKKLVISAILESELGKAKAEDATNSIITALSIKEEISKLDKLLDEEVKRHEKAVKEIKKQILEIRKKCKHWSRTYHPDPSGNNDSFHECNLCGLET